MSRSISELENRDRIIGIQGTSIRILGALLAAAIGALFWVNTQITLHIPPDLSAGTSLKPGDTPKHNVYLFALNIWQQVNRWPNDGQKDYGEQLFKYQAYITPRCRAWLEANREFRSKNGELAGRVRAVMEAPGTSFSDDRVDSLGAGAWKVRLDTEIMETVRGIPVKRAGVRWPMRVVRFDVDRQVNPYKLALDCFDANDQPSKLVLQEEAAAPAPTPSIQGPSFLSSK